MLAPAKAQVTLATADGCLVSVRQLSEQVTEVLLALQRQMQGPNYDRFNQVNIKGETKQARPMINLDIVLGFLSLQTHEQADLADAVSQNLDEKQRLTTQQLRLMVACLK